MNCYHHPSAKVLVELASGQLTELHELMINMHCKICHSCAQAKFNIESLGGNALMRTEDAELKSDAFDQLKRHLDKKQNRQLYEVDQKKSSSIIEKLLNNESANSLNWHWRTKRFAELSLSVNDANYEAKLIYIKKGMKILKHTHRDKELTLVLQGRFSDVYGEYARGDYICYTSAQEHAPLAESDCICFVITKQSLKFTGTFGPVFNWFFKKRTVNQVS